MYAASQESGDGQPTAEGEPETGAEDVEFEEVEEVEEEKEKK